jgi:predicted O-linked N-acetylglucosamine transferase (SPINDLY family)
VITGRDNIGSLSIIQLISMVEQLDGSGRKDMAVELYEEWIRQSESPLKFAVHFNLGVLYAEMQEIERAIIAYKQAVELNPDFIQAHLNIGSLLERGGRHDEALAQWRLALLSKEINMSESKSLRLLVLNNLGRLLEIQRQFKPALDLLEQSLALDPTQSDVMIHLVHLAQKICRWPIYAPPKGMELESLVKGTSPLAMLAASDDPAAQLAVSKRFIAFKYPISNHDPLASYGGYHHDKIRIGYLSSNLSMHAVSLLTVELFELHDRNNFEVYGFCWSHEDGTAFRERVIRGFDHFIRIGDLSDKDAADTIRYHEIDILVDLQGLTSGARPLILSYRPAPLQMTYLGFPGPTGLPWIDYVIADRYMIPEEEIQHYTEKPLYLPNCFQVSDSKRLVGAMPKRSDYSLPDGAFVFCSFNNNYKYTPEMFSIWMRILRRIPKSVLWLLADNEWAKENLCKAAKKMGVKRERLIFASRVTPADYLARYQLADLFLDTYPFNGGTTANDALFMKLPLLTLSGRTFASRYAGSILMNLGVPELIAGTKKEYEEKAIRLAKHPVELATIKKKLGENASVVYDMPSVVRDMERMFIQTLGNGVIVKTELNSSGRHSVMSHLSNESSDIRPKLPKLKTINPLELINFSSPVNWEVKDPEKFAYHMGEALKLVESGYYLGDNLFTWARNNSLFEDSSFVESWQKNSLDSVDQAVAWRRYLLTCAACHCIQLHGDFVECGVYQGSAIKTVIDYFGVSEFDRTFWGYDTFDYNPVDGQVFIKQTEGLYARTLKRFEGYNQVRLVQGLLPDSLEDNSPDLISYLHIDLNSAEYEIAVLDRLFNRVVSGGIVILDDYEWASIYRQQKIQEDKWFEERGYRVFPLPTGQGFILKR